MPLLRESLRSTSQDDRKSQKKVSLNLCNTPDKDTILTGRVLHSHSLLNRGVVCRGREVNDTIPLRGKASSC
jgi:hypothetical protein